VRYAESDGYRADGFRPGAWRYRDYVIEAFLRDKPYDRFIREQLAGDELYSDDPSAVIGTAFLRHGIYEWNQRNARMHWELILNEMTNVTGEVFLGLGIGCAQCHDHKFDPILQEDYYALQAFLSTVYWPTDAPLATPSEIADYETQRRVWETRTAAIRNEMDGLLKKARENKRTSTIEQFPADIQAMVHKPAGTRTPYEAQMVELVRRQIVAQQAKINPKKTLQKQPEKWARYQELENRLKKWDEVKPDPLPRAFVATDIGSTPAKTYLERRRGKVEVEPAFLTLLNEPQPSIEPRGESTGRRTALANWIASADNPLSTRVIVNRVWQGHFGTGIVATTNDFGNLGEGPSHPQLLDWLTRRFLEQGWQFKPLHRLILTSATYRQTARREPGRAESETDPENRLLWRFPPARLSAEQIRDSMLALSGELNDRDGGSSVPGDRPVRSVYVRKMRNKPDPVLHSFDAPLGFDSAPARLETTTPIQSLLLVNGPWALQRAHAMARRLRSEGGTLAEFVERAYRLVYGRSAKPNEIASATNFLREQETLVARRASSNGNPASSKQRGLAPMSDSFAAVKHLDLGSAALSLHPGTRFESLRVTNLSLQEDAFTIEAVAVLDSLHQDASVNTLLSRWNGNSEQGGWTFGVTSEKSRYDPRNFIVQLTGENSAGNMEYAVVASNLRVPLGRPVYLAAVISARDGSGEGGGGKVRFFLRDLSRPDAPLETAAVPHPITGGIQEGGSSIYLSGRASSNRHHWDGQVARLRVVAGTLGPEALLIGDEPSADPLRLDLRFEGDEEEPPAPGLQWVRRSRSPQGETDAPQLQALTDFCHALLNSNEFLFLH